MCWVGFDSGCVGPGPPMRVQDAQLVDELETDDDEDWESAAPASSGTSSSPTRKGFRSYFGIKQRRESCPPSQEEVMKWDESQRRGTVGEEHPTVANFAMAQPAIDTKHLTANGRLQKRSPGWVNGWRDFCFVLRDKML